MQVTAIFTPTYTAWRWRTVGVNAEVVEASSHRVPSIAAALAEGTERLARP